MTTELHPYIGIDVGKGEIVVAIPPTHSKTPTNKFPTITLNYDDPTWWQTLTALLAPNAIIAAEPTGHHLLAPIAAIIHHVHPDAQLWQVEGKQTARYRESYVSSAKNDRLDSIALLLIARDIAAGKPPRNCRPYDHHHESAVQRLRMRVNIHARLTKDRTRALNRLNVLAHSLWPSFPKSETWLRAARAGYITPNEIKALAAADPPPAAYADGRVRRPLKAFANTLPPIDGDPAVVAGILDHLQTVDALTAQINANLEIITAIIDSPPFELVTRRWRTIPSSSDIYIAAIHVAVQGRALDYDKDQFRSALGTTPKTSTSGDGDRTRQSRKGFRPARAAIHMWTVSLCNPMAAANAVRTYYQGAEARSFAAARNKLGRVLWGVARDASLDKADPAQSRADQSKE